MLFGYMSRLWSLQNTSPGPTTSRTLSPLVTSPIEIFDWRMEILSLKVRGLEASSHKVSQFLRQSTTLMGHPSLSPSRPVPVCSLVGSIVENAGVSLRGLGLTVSYLLREYSHWRSHRTIDRPSSIWLSGLYEFFSLESFHGSEIVKE